MSFSTKDTFNYIIDELNAGNRPLIVLNEQQIATINAEWKESLQEKKLDNIIPLLCICDNTRTLSKSFYHSIIETLETAEDPELITLTLGTARRQIIEEHHMRGERLSMDFIKLLERFLGAKEPEVVEWSLRLIESLGSQSIILKPAVLKAKPGFLKVFNNHKRNISDIIELLESRWTR